MAQATPSLPPQLVDRIEALFARFWTEMQTSATKAQVTAYHDLIARMGADEEFKAAFGATLVAHWTESDANNDGKLDAQEFKTYIAKRKACEESEHGIWLPSLDNTFFQELWGCLNAVS